MKRDYQSVDLDLPIYGATVTSPYFRPGTPPPGSSNLPTCGTCGSAVWPGNYHSCKPVEHPKGWQCPVCGTVYAPTVPACHNAHHPPAKAATGTNDCGWCPSCVVERGRFMVVCPDCGNKRCPKAAHHDNPCSGSNDPGQSGSRYA